MFQKPTTPFFFSQPLSINVPTLAMAENMADLIDGYCRLVNNVDISLILRSNKGNEITYTSAMKLVNRCT